MESEIQMANDDNLPTTNVFGGKVNVANVASLANRAKEAAQNNPRGGAPNGSDYMNFSGKRGMYTIGQDQRKIQPEELWVIDVTSFEEGWICWKGGKPVSTRLSNIYNGSPVLAPNGDEGGPFDTNKGEGWFQAKAMVLRSIDNGQQGYLKLNSVSGVSAMAELIGEFAERAEQGQPHWPVVGLDVEEFESQGFKNFKPKFVAYGWLDNEQLQEVADGGDISQFIEFDDEPAPPPPVRTQRRRA